MPSIETSNGEIFLGVVGFVVSMGVAGLVEIASIRFLTCVGLVLAIIGVIPAAVMKPGQNFWAVSLDLA
jgi:hypothetical protein